MPAIACLLAIALAGPKPIFAGWVRDGLIEVRTGATTVAPAWGTGFRLYAGQKVRTTKGSATLLIYGRQFDLPAGKGWYTIPADARHKPAGKDVYAKYISRAGRTRGDELAERLWLAFSLVDLPKPDRAFHVRLVPAKPSYRPGDRITIEVDNETPNDYHLTILDIDSEARVSVLTKDQPVIPSRSGWRKVGDAFFLGLPAKVKEAEEHLQVLATTNTIDITGFEAQNKRRQVPMGLNPLAYLLSTLNGEEAGDPGVWTTNLVTFTIRR